MPVHNAAPYLEASIRSILEQRYTDFEFIVIDDGSTDGSANIITSFCDDRIRFLRQPNAGIVAALNAGIAVARGEFIARHDADDLALTTRFSEQVTYLDAHPDVGLLGTWATVTDAHNNQIGSMHHPMGHAAITYALIFDSALVHPSVMMRKQVLHAVGGYVHDAKVFEDHVLWWRMAHITRIANIPEELVRYRVLPSGASRIGDREMRLVEQRRRNMSEAFREMDPRSLQLLMYSGLRHIPISWQELRTVHRLLRRTIRRIGGSPEEQDHMRTDMNGRLMGFHLVQRTGLATRVLDRLAKTIALALPTFDPRS